MSSEKPKYSEGHQPPISFQSKPGLQKDMPQPAPGTETVPQEDGGYQRYKAAGKLEGKHAIITGGDSGIGRATAVLFAMEGADSLIAYLPQEEEDAQQTKKLVEKYGAQCYLVQSDLRDRKNCKLVVDKALEKMGKNIDILFNNHATQQVVYGIENLTEEQWLETFDTNIHPFFFLSKYCLPHMPKGSAIINNASINAYIGRPDLLDYTSTKGAIVSFTRGLSNQLLQRGVRVNGVAPGPVWTPLVPATMTREAQESFNSPMGRPSQPSEIATCVVFLASTDSSSVTGQIIHCNGGTIVNG